MTLRVAVEVTVPQLVTLEDGTTVTQMWKLQFSLTRYSSRRDKPNLQI